MNANNPTKERSLLIDVQLPSRSANQSRPAINNPLKLIIYLHIYFFFAAHLLPWS